VAQAKHLPMRALLSCANLLIYFLAFAYVASFSQFHSFHPRVSLRKNESLHLYALFGRGSVFIPKNGADRDSQAIDAVKAALGNAKANLIECEFPVLEQLNKLGDGSLRSAKIAEEANLNFVAKLVKSLKPIPLIGPPLLLLSSSSSSNSFSASVQDVASKLGVGFLSLREGDISEKLDGKTVLVFVNPSSSTDYNLARKASSKTKTLLINGFAKVRHWIFEFDWCIV